MASCSCSRELEEVEVKMIVSMSFPELNLSLGDGSTVGNIVQILVGLAKSYFNIKGKTNSSIQVRRVFNLSLYGMMHIYCYVLLTFFL